MRYVLWILTACVLVSLILMTISKQQGGLRNALYLRADSSFAEPVLLNAHTKTTDQASIYLENVRESVFLMSAFVVSQEEIRVTFISECDYFPNMTLHIEGKEFPLAVEQLEDCKKKWLSVCSNSGRYAIARIPPAISASVNFANVTVSVGRTGRPETRRKITLFDARIPKSEKREHVLAVCTWPVSLFAEWTEIVQFFEIWIEHGATKFFLMYQSVSKEVDAVISLYEHDKQISVERIHWAPLPAPQGGRYDDPNTRLFSGEQLFAGNECMLRARGKTKFVALVDPDEVFVAPGNFNMIDVINNTVNSKPNIGTVVFRSSHGTLQRKEWRSATHPDQLSFDVYNNISLETKVWPVGSMSKLVSIPERVRHQGVHFSTAMEAGFESTVVDPAIAMIIHLRPVRWMYADDKIAKPSLIMQKYTKSLNERYARRISDEKIRLRMDPGRSKWSLRNESWSNKGMQIMEELEECRQKLMSRSSVVCPTYYKCTDMLSVPRSYWTYADDNWIVL